MIRLLIADDHQVVAAGIAALVDTAPDLEVAGIASGGEEAVTMTAALRPDLVVMDLSMPVVDGVEATRRIAAETPGARILMLTAFIDQVQILAALDAGAAGYMLKDAPPEELLAAIRSAHRGEAPLDPRAARAVLAARNAYRQPDLTRREQEVLALVGVGLANKQIARRLAISEKTVKAHLTSVFHRLGVTDRTQAALWYQQYRQPTLPVPR